MAIIDPEQVKWIRIVHSIRTGQKHVTVIHDGAERSFTVSDFVEGKNLFNTCIQIKGELVTAEHVARKLTP